MEILDLYKLNLQIKYITDWDIKNIMPRIVQVI